jgi:hypothetical protein
MQRRDFIKHGGIAGVLAAGSAPAFAQNTPVKWRLASSYPKTLDTLIGAVEMVSKRVSELTANRFQIQVFGPGEIVPALQVFDAVQNGTVEAGHTASYFYIGKNPAFGFGTAMPFGMNTRQQNAWLYLGGGIEMLNEFYKTYGVIGFPVGNTGAQMGGWFRKEIKTVADLKGLKMRIGGLGGMVLSKLGVIPQQIGGGDLYAALEKGVIDSAEWPAKNRQVLLLPRLVGRLRHPASLHQPEALGRVAQGVPAGAANRLRRSQPVDDRQVRRRQPRGAEAPGRRRHPTAPVLPRHHGSFLQGRRRALHRTLGQEPRVQDHPRQLHEVPRRTNPLVARLRRRLRQLHGLCQPVEKIGGSARQKTRRAPGFFMPQSQSWYPPSTPHLEHRNT